MNSRLKYNLKILKILEKYFRSVPDIRFFQALWNFGIIEWEDTSHYIIKDKHYEESYQTLKKLKE